MKYSIMFLMLLLIAAFAFFGCDQAPGISDFGDVDPKEDAEKSAPDCTVDVVIPDPGDDDEIGPKDDDEEKSGSDGSSDITTPDPGDDDEIGPKDDNEEKSGPDDSGDITTPDPGDDTEDDPEDDTGESESDYSADAATPEPGDEIVEFIIEGCVFTDFNRNGMFDMGEVGISDVEVTLNVDYITYTDETGYFFYDCLSADNYEISVGVIDGMEVTGPATINLGYVELDTIVYFGFAYDFNGQIPGDDECRGVGFWKNNIRKAIIGQENGVQVPAHVLVAYLEEISTFALPPFSFTELEEAFDVLAATGPDAVDLLSRQLLAAEFNFMNGCLVDEDYDLTVTFLTNGEYMVQNADDFSRDELLEAKDSYQSFNHNGKGSRYQSDGS